MASAKDGEGLVPEREVVDEVRHVEAESIHAVRMPVFGRAENGEPVIIDFNHGRAEPCVGVVELGGVGPVAIEEGGSVLGLDVVFGVLGHPDVITGRVIGGDVEKNLELEGMCLADEGQDVFLSAVFRFHADEVTGGVGGADAFAGKKPDGIGRHEIQGVETETLHSRQIACEISQWRFGKGFLRGGFNGVAGFARGEGAQVDLIDDGRRQPGSCCVHGGGL